MKNLIQHIKKRIDLTEREERLIASKVLNKNLKKKEHLLKGGEINTRLSYIKKGCLRVYSIDSNGFENNVFFGLEDWWIIDLKSFIEQTSARFFIEALEDCELNQISKDSFDLLLEEVPRLEKWFRLLLQNALISSENRIYQKSAFSAEERYLKFIEKYPLLEARISQKHIASYLGISPEFLSKLKADRWKRAKS